MKSLQSQAVTVDYDEVVRTLEALDFQQAETKKAVKGALRKSLGIVRKSAIRGAAAVTTNRLKQQKGVNLKIYRDGSGGNVSIRKSFYVDGSWFALRLLERGTEDGIDRKGRHHGATPAKPFFVDSTAGARQVAERDFRDNLLTQIDKVASRRK